MRNARTGKAADRKATIRCAIYTRKSSEEGLEQEFNSLGIVRVNWLEPPGEVP